MTDGPTRTRWTRLAPALAGLALVAACGSNDPDTVGRSADDVYELPEGYPSPTPDAPSAPSPTPTAEGGAEVLAGDFVLLDGRPAGYDELAGTARLLITDRTTFTVSLTGLPPGAALVSHVHTAPCAQDQGGPHFAFDPAGPAEPPNELHLMLTADDAGTATASTTNPRPVPPEARSVVVHEQQEGMAPKIACADLTAEG